MLHKLPGVLVLALMFGMVVQAWAEDGRSKGKPTPELLDYLGRFDSGDGRWMDPTEVEKMRMPNEPGGQPRRYRDRSDNGKYDEQND